MAARGRNGRPKITSDKIRVERFKYWENGRALPYYRAVLYHEPTGDKLLGLRGFVTEDYFEKAIIIAKRNLAGEPPIRYKFQDVKK